MNAGRRCAEKCNGSTTKNAIVYFPPGTYRISSTIPMPFGTQVIGDANDRPTLLAAPSFVGLGVLAANMYTGGGKGPDGLDQQWYVNTANFYRQIRNIKIDLTLVDPAHEVARLHYQATHATSLQSIEIVALPGRESKQRGIFAENGSGGVISDVTFRGGRTGLHGGSQQFMAQRLTFIGCQTGVHVIWGWSSTWKSINMTNVKTGFRLVTEDKSSDKIGSATFIDSSFNSVQTAVLIAPPSSKAGSGSTGVVLDNVAFANTSQAVADTSGATLLDAPADKVHHWALGNLYQDKGPKFSMGHHTGTFRRHPGLLNGDGAFFERPKPQYGDRPVGDFFHVKDYGARGDGVTDDTAAIQRALYESQGRILFFNAGSYIITRTVTVPINMRIVGEAWSQLVATGSFFADAKNPRVMLKVGQEGSVGVVEMQGLIFTSRGPTAGLVLVEWNIRAATKGSAGIWDCHVRVGGATDTELTSAKCPALTSSNKAATQGCKGASLMVHITPHASGYFENMWLWAADHTIDDQDREDANNSMPQTSVYVARGLLVESTRSTWLYGTVSEHSVLYQYNFHKARNIFTTSIQAQSPYYQPVPKPSAPFESAVGKMAGDPDYSCRPGNEFSGCDGAWAVVVRNSSNILVAGAVVQSWFSAYKTPECVGKHECQSALMLLDGNHAGVRFQSLVTIGAKNMAVMNNVGVSAVDHLAVDYHPAWSQISLLDVSGDGANAEPLRLSPEIWNMDKPSFTCVPPCVVSIPPWTRATRVIEYPRVTVCSPDGWSTTITRSPLLVTEVHFEAVTLTVQPKNNAGSTASTATTTTGIYTGNATEHHHHRRQEASSSPEEQPLSDFWPNPATTAGWPPVTFTDPDGNVVQTAPTEPVPAPPDTIGPDTPAPTDGGSWPGQPIEARAGLQDNFLPDLSCDADPFLPGCDNFNSPWEFGEFGEAQELFSFAPYEDEDYGAEDVACPTTTSSSSTKTTTSAKQTESPLEEGRPEDNIKHCYGSGQKATNGQLARAAESFCRSLKQGEVLRNPILATGGKDLVKSANLKPAANGQWQINIDLELVVRPNCQFTVNHALCERYMKVAINSCNCGGVDGKQGGTVENRCLKFRIDPQTF